MRVLDRNQKRFEVRSAWSLRSSLCLLALCLLFVGSTQAQVLEEIVVTATKRSASLQDVGVSVNAFTGADIERQGLRDSQEILLKVPNVDIRANAGATNANIFLRGVGSAGISFNLQNGVGMYADEVVLNSPVVNILQTFDLERVEVLRGPQNTLYGRNTTGGAVNFITRKPEIGGEANGRASLTYGRFNQVDFDGAYGAPLGERAAFRIAAQRQQRNGIRRNLSDGTDNVDNDKFAIRAQLAFEPNDQVSVNLKAHLERVRSENIRFKNVGAYAPNATGPDPSQLCATPFEFGACNNGFGFVGSRDDREINSDMSNPENDVNAGGASAHINIDFENFTLTSITGYEENSQDLSEDTDAFDQHSFHFFIESEQDQWSQEIRLASNEDQDFRWIVGAYGFWEDKTGTTGPTFGTPMGIMLVRSLANFENDTYSGYADLEYDVSDKVTLKGGLRFSSDNIDGNSIALFAFESQLGGLDITGPSFSGDNLPDFEDLLAAAEASGAGIIRIGGPTDPDAEINDTTFDEWGGKLGVDFRPNENVLAYAQWSRGFKAGIFPNAPMAIMLGLGDTAIEPEIVNSYEVGIKTELADGAARLNAAAFFSDYTDQQINQFVNGEFTVVNVDSEIWGAEVDLTWLPAEGMFVEAGIGILDTEIVESQVVEQLGNKLLSAPEFTAQASIRKEWNMSNGGLFGISGDWRYASKRYFDLGNNTEDGAYDIVNAQAYYEWGPDGNYRVSAWAKNLFDEIYFNNRFLFDDNGDGFTDFQTVYLNEPATYGLTFGINF